DVNLFEYVSGQPTSHVDPDGLAAILILCYVFIFHGNYWKIASCDLTKKTARKCCEEKYSVPGYLGNWAKLPVPALPKINAVNCCRATCVDMCSEWATSDNYKTDCVILCNRFKGNASNFRTDCLDNCLKAYSSQ